MKRLFNKIRHFFTFRNNAKTPTFDLLELPSEEQSSWWGRFSVEEDQSRFTKIGNIVLCIDHYNSEWHIASYNESEKKMLSKNLGVQILKGDLSLMPILPDRAILFSLERSFFLPVQSSMTLYLSTPAFIRIEVGNPPIYLDEIPTEILSDTWAGKNTLAGELCYYGNSFATLRLEDVPRDNIHVTTPITLMNQSTENILIKELKMPAPFLSIFSDSQNHLWSEQITIAFEQDRSTDTNIIKGPPKGLNHSKQLAEARSLVKSGLKGLFSPKRN